jgi:hypothetical protein
MSTTRSFAFAKLSSKISNYTSTPQVRGMHIAYTPRSCRKAIHSHKEFHIEGHGTHHDEGYQVRAPSYFATKLKINLDLKLHMTRRHVLINPPKHPFKVLVRTT